MALLQQLESLTMETCILLHSTTRIALGSTHMCHTVRPLNTFRERKTVYLALLDLSIFLLLTKGDHLLVKTHDRLREVLRQVRASPQEAVLPAGDGAHLPDEVGHLLLIGSAKLSQGGGLRGAWGEARFSHHSVSLTSRFDQKDVPCATARASIGEDRLELTAKKPAALRV